MGTYYVVKLYSEERTDGLGEQIKSRLDELNAIFSTYDPNSELSRINKAQAGKEITMSEELREVLELSAQINKEASGYFDVTVGPIVNAWGFGPDGKRKRPTEKELNELRAKVGMHQFKLEGPKLVKSKSDIYIDLSAIAKGYAVDKILELVQSKGFKSALVEIGGEVRAFGKKPDGASWLIGIEKPEEKLGQGIQAIVALNDSAMATSGGYRNYVKYGDAIFTHTIDPIKGVPANNRMISVTIVDSSCVKADAYATAMLAMGADKALALAKKLKLAAYFIVKKGENIDIIVTDSLKPYLQEM
ncbi:MAG: FAD:protein FMN transferase [Bacteriovoracaceae bacterium]|nr:FAD:protein FMN transferase [Bacteriovoracaceae bacterium]